jgi:hypothetical protein
MAITLGKKQLCQRDALARRPETGVTNSLIHSVPHPERLHFHR